MYTPPTIATIKAQIISDIESEIGQNTPLLSRAFIRVLAKALSGVLALAYRVVLWVYQQIHPETAEEESIAYYEDRYGLTPSPAVAAVLAVSIAGTDGSTCPAGTYWTNEDNGLVYTQAAAANISGGVATASLTCLTAGEDSTLAAAAVLTLVSPLSGIESATVTAITTEGQAADTLEDRRAAVIARMQRTDEIGTTGWYISTALDVSGVAFARVERNTGGDIDVYPLMAVTGSARIPDSTELATIQTYLQDASRRPLCANVYALASVERTATVTISGLSPSDETTKAAITSAWEAYCYAAYPRQFSDDADATDVISLGAIWAMIIAAGATATAVSLTISDIGSGVTSYTLPIGEILAPGAITWA
jgi:uncharacterized phage protein gp47/JayE